MVLQIGKTRFIVLFKRLYQYPYELLYPSLQVILLSVAPSSLPHNSSHICSSLTVVRMHPHNRCCLLVFRTLVIIWRYRRMRFMRCSVVLPFQLPTYSSALSFALPSIWPPNGNIYMSSLKLSVTFNIGEQDNRASRYPRRYWNNRF